jgi:HSP20 family protein
MANKRKSFFERLTGAVNIEDDEEEAFIAPSPVQAHRERPGSILGEEPDAELTVDVYQTPDKIVVKTLVAGVKPEDLDVTIARDMITIRGRREGHTEVMEDDYFHRELFWGSFSRTIMLPQEVDPEEAEAVERHGLLIITIPKLDKSRQTKLKVRSNG